MKLLSFRIFDYKSIIDSGQCELSSDNITILAGQNESGKTSILEALRDFDLDREISSEAKPDGRDNAKPRVVCIFSSEEKDIEGLEDDTGPVDIPNQLKGIILKSGKVMIAKAFPSNQYSLGEMNIDAWKKELQNTLPTGEEALDPDSVQKRIAAALMRRTPYFIHFDSFTDELPKKKYLDQIANKAEIGYQAVQDFLRLADIDVERLKTEVDDKNVSNYLEQKCASVTGDFLTYWTQRVDGVNQVQLIAERNHDAQGHYLNFYVKDANSKNILAKEVRDCCGSSLST